MMRHYLLIALIDVLLGFDFPINKVAPMTKSFLLPSLNNLPWHAALSMGRRRSSGYLSDECSSDIQSDSIWCIDPRFSCDGLEGDHTKWVIHIDHYNEHMCYPSSCSANDLKQLYLWYLEQLNSTAQYCTFDCPPIKFNVSATSEDDETMEISGMYRYADLSYDCVGAAAMVEISMCEETGACPSDADGLTTCTLHFEDRLRYAEAGMRLKMIGQECLSNECITEANLEKLEDYLYAWLIHLQLVHNDLYFTPEEIRAGYLVKYSCPTLNSTIEEKTSSQNYSNYVLIFGVTSGALFLFCVLAICFLRIYRGGGVTMTPIISVELNNRETFTAVYDISNSSK